MNQNSEEISLKQCPLCKTSILKTQRFMSQVKVILSDIGRIKKKLYEKRSILKFKLKNIFDSLKYLNSNFYNLFIDDPNQYDTIKDVWDIFCLPILNKLGSKNNKSFQFYMPAKDIESIEFIIDLFKSISKYKKQIGNIKDDQKKQMIINHFACLLHVAFTYAQQLSQQQQLDINMEMARGVRIVNLFELMSSQKYEILINMQSSDAMELKNILENMEVILMSFKKYTVERDDEIQQLTELIKNKFDGICVITDEERKMIHTAMSTNFHGGLRAQGHWYKCSNNHIYCVTECGGPMQQSNCPVCKVPIGGTGHINVAGVSRSTEMDRIINLQ